MKVKKYDGKDPSGTWKVVDYEGKTIILKSESGKSKQLTGFDGYNSAADAAAATHGGVPVRE